MNITFLMDEFALKSPGQQILDRCVFGYPWNGMFLPSPTEGITAYLPQRQDTTLIVQRAKEHRIQLEANVSEAILSTTNIAILTRDPQQRNEWLEVAARTAPTKANLFVLGGIFASLTQCQSLLSRMHNRGMKLFATTRLTHTWRLPDTHVPEGAAMKRALCMVPGEFPQAEEEALDFLFSWIGLRLGGEKGIRQIQRLAGEGFWQHLKGHMDLVAAAVSRSNSPLGDSVRDGRTQDIVGLGMLPDLVSHPRGWILHHEDGLQSILLTLSGATSDALFACELQEGTILSTQIYRPPEPNDHQYTPLTQSMLSFFESGVPPWSAGREELFAGTMDRIQQLAVAKGSDTVTPELSIPYASNVKTNE